MLGACRGPPSGVSIRVLLFESSCRQVLLAGTCPDFKHAEPFPYTEFSPSERKAHWEWKQRKIKDYSSLGL